MPTLATLLEQNREWAERAVKIDPQFFQRLVDEQNPKYLWIGCSDSRVPANEIMNLLPGEVFVHRNIANLVKINDANCMSVLQYAIEVLKIKHIIVTGHYGCGGILAATQSQVIHGRLGAWLSSIRELHQDYLKESPTKESPASTMDRMCELNVLQQTRNLSRTEVVRNAWAQGEQVELHSWIYRLSDGIISPLRKVICEPEFD
jgi:carbonic anhydrase